MLFHIYHVSNLMGHMLICLVISLKEYEMRVIIIIKKKTPVKKQNNSGPPGPPPLSPTYSDTLEKKNNKDCSTKNYFERFFLLISRFKDYISDLIYLWFYL